jgi:hypothetical protein
LLALEGENDMLDWMPVVQWFGFLPNFHDAQVISIDLRRAPEPSVIRVDAWRTLKEVDERGYFKMDRRAVVRFVLMNIVRQEFDGWNHQNVLNKLTVTEEPDGQLLSLESTFGVDGYLVAKHITVEIEQPARV